MEAYIYDSLRTPRGRGNKKGALTGTTATQLVVTVMDELRQRHDLDTSQVEDMILGCVTQIMDQGANVAKTAAQHSGYGEHLTAVTLNRFCGSGLEAVNQAAAYVKAGFNDLMFSRFNCY
jgi:acetyl-CoA C-acetyltransferase